MAWVAGLAIDGVNDWRLPNGPIVDCVTGLFGTCSDNEMAYLFHEEGISASAPGPFNIPFNPNTGIFYWTGTEIDADQATDFSFGNGDQSIGMKIADDYAWAVHDGDVATIPIPQALLLFGSGLLGLVGVARVKQDQQSVSR